jgi:hypothetical protein
LWFHFPQEGQRFAGARVAISSVACAWAVADFLLPTGPIGKPPEFAVLVLQDGKQCWGVPLGLRWSAHRMSKW